MQRGSWHIVQRVATSAACQLNAPALVCFAFRLCRPSAQELRLQCLLAMRTCTYPHRHTHMHTNAHRRPLCRCHPGPTPTHTLAHPSRGEHKPCPWKVIESCAWVEPPEEHLGRSGAFFGSHCWQSHHVSVGDSVRSGTLGRAACTAAVLYILVKLRKTKRSEGTGIATSSGDALLNASSPLPPIPSPLVQGAVDQSISATRA